MLAMRWSSLKAVWVPTSVKGGLRGSTATSDLVHRSIKFVAFVLVPVFWHFR